MSSRSRKASEPAPLLSRRTLLGTSAGAAALVLLPAVSRAPRALASSASSAGTRHVFIYGRQAPSAGTGSALQATRPLAVRNATTSAVKPVSTGLATIPVQSADESTLVLVSVSEDAGLAEVTLNLLDTMSANVVARGTLALQDFSNGAMLLLAPVISAEGTTVAVVMSITVPTDERTIGKLDPRTGGVRLVKTATWTSHHELAYFDRATATFTGPFNLGDHGTLPRTNAVVDQSRLFLWTVDEATPRVRTKGAFKTRNGHRPEARVSAFAVGSGTPLFTVSAPGPWPVSGEPVSILAGGEIIRLAYARTVEVYSPITGRAVEHEIPRLRGLAARQGVPLMQVRPDGLVFIASPGIGRAVLVDPAHHFTTVAAIGFPVPASPASTPSSKAALSTDGRTLYVLGSARLGGLASYDISTGRLVASYSDEEHYSGLYLLDDGTLLATSTTSPKLNYFAPDLGPLGSVDVPLSVTAVF
jgi:hypothetical protein